MLKNKIWGIISCYVLQLIWSGMWSHQDIDFIWWAIISFSIRSLVMTKFDWTHLYITNNPLTHKDWLSIPFIVLLHIDYHLCKYSCIRMYPSASFPDIQRCTHSSFVTVMAMCPQRSITLDRIMLQLEHRDFQIKVLGKIHLLEILLSTIQAKTLHISFRFCYDPKVMSVNPGWGCVTFCLSQTRKNNRNGKQLWLSLKY